jgi:hypothetical protein
MGNNFLDRQNEPIEPIKFVEKGKSTAQSPLVFMDQTLNSRFNYAILKTTENGRYIRGNMLWYMLNGVEIYTEINNIIFVDEANKSLFIRGNDSVVNEIAPDNPEEKQYIILYTDSSFDEYGDEEVPLKWESYIGRSNAFQAIKANLYDLDPDKSLVLVENVALKDSLTVRQFVEYLKNADIIDEEIVFEDYE